jgi:hypothetical protein
VLFTCVALPVGVAVGLGGRAAVTLVDVPPYSGAGVAALAASLSVALLLLSVLAVGAHVSATRPRRRRGTAVHPNHPEPHYPGSDERRDGGNGPARGTDTRREGSE